MASWSDLSGHEQSTANQAINHYNDMPQHHKDGVLEAAVHEVEAWARKTWPYLTPLAALYVAKRLKGHA